MNTALRSSARRRDPAILPGLCCIIAGLGLATHVLLSLAAVPPGSFWFVSAYHAAVPAVGLGLTFGAVTAGLTMLAPQARRAAGVCLVGCVMASAALFVVFALGGGGWLLSCSAVVLVVTGGAALRGSGELAVPASP